jgi:hypothetical protein
MTTDASSVATDRFVDVATDATGCGKRATRVSGSTDTVVVAYRSHC